MIKQFTKTTYLVLGILILLSAGIITHGCREEQNQTVVTRPATSPQNVIYLNVAHGMERQAKATGLTVTAANADTNAVVASQSFANPQFPVNLNLEFTVPPCQYVIAATATLTSGETRLASATIDACNFNGGTIVLSITTYEPFQIAGALISAPDSANAGVTIQVACTANLTAPDIAAYPIAVVLSEASGSSVNGTFRNLGDSVSGSFPDPYPVTYGSSPTRTLACTLSDDRGTTQSETRIVARITPTPTPTGVCLTDATTVQVDGSSATRTFTVTGLGTVTKVTSMVTFVKFDENSGSSTLTTTPCGTTIFDSSPLNGEIRYTLQSPDGTSVILINGYTDSTTYGGLVTVTLDDTGGVMSAYPTSGTFQPNQPLSGFAGKAANGTWTLTVQDTAGADPLCHASATLCINK